MASKLLRRLYTLTYVYLVEPEDLLHIPYPENVQTTIADAGGVGLKLPLYSVETRLYYRIKAQMEFFSPHMILIFTGFNFRQYKDDVAKVLQKISEEYPDTHFGHINSQKEFKHRKEDGRVGRAQEMICEILGVNNNA